MRTYTRCIGREREVELCAVYVLFHEPLKEIYLRNLDCTPLNGAAAVAAVVPTNKHALISPMVVVVIFAVRTPTHRACIGNKMLFFVYDYVYYYIL